MVEGNGTNRATLAVGYNTTSERIKQSGATVSVSVNERDKGSANAQIRNDVGVLRLVLTKGSLTKLAKQESCPESDVFP